MTTRQQLHAAKMRARISPEAVAQRQRRWKLYRPPAIVALLDELADRYLVTKAQILDTRFRSREAIEARREGCKRAARMGYTWAQRQRWIGGENRVRRAEYLAETGRV